MGLQVQFKEMPREKKLVLAWFASATFAILFPLIMYWGDHAIGNGEEQNNDGQQQQEQGYYSACGWWQFSCKRRERNYWNNQNGGNNGENGDENNMVPWWWFFGNEEARRQREENGQASGALIFVYLWMLVLFAGILVYGYRLIRATNSDLRALTASLVVFANLGLISMILLGGLEGGVQTEGREVEERGFYAQFPVLMFLTSFFLTIFGVVFAAVFRKEQSTRELEAKEAAAGESYWPSL